MSSRVVLRWFWGRFLGSLRVLALFGVIAALALTLGLRQARAQLGETLLGFGNQLFEWEGAHPHSRVRTMHLNGARFQLVSMSFDKSVADTLDRFDADCERSGGLLSELDLSPTRFREEAGGEGVLACFDTQGRKTPGQLMERVKSFTESGDLSDIGSFRFVLARQSRETTTALVLWTDGGIPLKKMFPKEGDAPGVDPEGVPRMPGTRRLLSAAESGQPYSATLYRTPEEANPLSWYAASLESDGWTIRGARRSGGFFASRGGRTVLVCSVGQGEMLGIFQLS